jgi:hypothetical protein
VLDLNPPDAHSTTRLDVETGALFRATGSRLRGGPAEAVSNLVGSVRMAAVVEDGSGFFPAGNRIGGVTCVVQAHGERVQRCCNGVDGLAGCAAKGDRVPAQRHCPSVLAQAMPRASETVQRAGFAVEVTGVAVQGQPVFGVV